MKVVILILTFVYVVTISGCLPLDHDDDPAPIEDFYDEAETEDYYEDQETSEDHFNLQEKREISAKLSKILEKVGKIFLPFFYQVRGMLRMTLTLAVVNAVFCAAFWFTCPKNPLAGVTVAYTNFSSR